MISKKIIAHRGVPALSHENTISSFETAMKFGADMIEFDIRRTADGVLVAFHDPFIFHLFSNVLLKDITFSDLQRIASNQNFTVPSLKDIFDKFAGKIGFDIEFKEEGCAEETLSMISDYKCEDKCIITSFNESIIKHIQTIWPHLQTGLLIGDNEIIQKCDMSTYSMLCPSKEFFLSNRDFFTDWKHSDRYIAVWTVDCISLLKQLLKDSLIDGIITNRCDRALKLQNQLLQNLGVSTSMRLRS